MSDSEGDYDNPFVVSANPGDIGCCRAFVDGHLVWDAEMTATASSDARVLEICVELLRSHTAGESLLKRQEHLAKAFTTPAPYQVYLHLINF